MVLDINVILSGLLWHGAPHDILDRVRSGAVRWITSPALLAELAEVLARTKFSSNLGGAGLMGDQPASDAAPKCNLPALLALPCQGGGTRRYRVGACC